MVSAEERKNGSTILSKYKATYEIRYENDQLKQTDIWEGREG